ncbi:SDR family NAD(P)-dependent oxidoreductase [Parasphingorhabdus sp.]|uniref:SDR family NAD(P)-dependent oxidoreductase n=1 Tax=Parasphingorhabdus sp. TaxID=2709688 RepID=UPI00300238F9
MNSGEFDRKVVFVTGGARGIGLAIAGRLGSEGASIVIADNDSDAGAEAVVGLTENGILATSVQCDVANEDEVKTAVGHAADRFGGIDILINNAGKHLLEYAVAPSALPPSKWRIMLEVNILGAVNSAAACRPLMAARGGGVIINMASTAGLVGNTAYGVSKLAVRGLTVGLAQEFATDSIRVCGVAPGLVDSPAAMAEIPAGRRAEFVSKLQLVQRPGEMKDVASLVRFLCSDEAAFITGETMVVSGGYPLHL